jgi:2-polyprenyl-3-methyl-5-hydroxy-6-metoxy-1,4-benzoquinol methylase
MTSNRDAFHMQEAWDRASATYLERRGSDVSTVSYGNLAPTEDELGLLGDVRGLHLLDTGCGGGQNSVACALRGAIVTGVDLSDAQLAAAQHLAQSHRVAIDWQQGDAASLGKQFHANFDLLLAIQVLPYLADPAATLRHVATLLRPGGRLIASIDHPIRNCFYDTEFEDFCSYPVRSYMDMALLRWNFDAGLPMQAYHQPLGVWIGWIAAAGLHIEQVIEAPAPLEICDELWSEDSSLAPLRNIPHTAIFVARAPEQ